MVLRGYVDAARDALLLERELFRINPKIFTKGIFAPRF